MGQAGEGAAVTWGHGSRASPDRASHSSGREAEEVEAHWREHFGGWTLLDCGTHSVIWNQTRTAYTHTFIPFLHCINYTESQPAYTSFLNTSKEIPRRYFAAASPLRLGSCSMNRASRIASAVLEVFDPRTILLQFWARLARKIKEGNLEKA